MVSGSLELAADYPGKEICAKCKHICKMLSQAQTPVVCSLNTSAQVCKTLADPYPNLCPMYPRAVWFLSCGQQWVSIQSPLSMPCSALTPSYHSNPHSFILGLEKSWTFIIHKCPTEGKILIFKIHTLQIGTKLIRSKRSRSYYLSLKWLTVGSICTLGSWSRWAWLQHCNLADKTQCQGMWLADIAIDSMIILILQNMYTAFTSLCLEKVFRMWKKCR